MPDELTPNLESFGNRLAKFYDRSKLEITQVGQLTTITIEKQPDLTEGFSLAKFCREHQVETCTAAIECEIEALQLVCGEIKYTPFNPKTLLPLLIQNRKGCSDD